MKRGIYLIAVSLLAITAILWAQTDQTHYYGMDRLRTLRSASGSLITAETTTAITGLSLFNICAVTLDITTATLPDVDDEVDFYLQTSYDSGTTWIDLANVHLANADNGSPQKTLIFISQTATGVAQQDDPTDGTIADDTNADRPIGDQMRIKTAITGATAPTYAYSATALFRP